MIIQLLKLLYFYKKNKAMEIKKDFESFLNILKNKEKNGTALFEFSICDEVCREFATKHKDAEPKTNNYYSMLIDAWRNMGYSFTTIAGWHIDGLTFPKGEIHEKSSRSQFGERLIHDRKSFEAYSWPDPEKGNYEVYEKMERHLPDDMKILSCSDGGVLENVIHLVGFEKLCFIYMMEPDLTKEIFDHVGERLLTYFKIVSSFPSVGVMVVNDDWGFKTQTLFSPDMMEEYVFPWHRKIVKAVHENNKPTILHSCGRLSEIMDVIIDDIGYMGKHSFEDNITPIEDAIDCWGERITLAGGIDMDFMVNSSEEEIKKRARGLVEKTDGKYSYLLGSGNSIPSYVPVKNFKALINCI